MCDVSKVAREGVCYVGTSEGSRTSLQSFCVTAYLLQGVIMSNSYDIDLNNITFPHSQYATILPSSQWRCRVILPPSQWRCSATPTLASAMASGSYCFASHQPSESRSMHRLQQRPIMSHISLGGQVFALWRRAMLSLQLSSRSNARPSC